LLYRIKGDELFNRTRVVVKKLFAMRLLRAGATWNDLAGGIPAVPALPHWEALAGRSCGITDQAADSASETSCASLVSAQTSSRMTFSVTS
jgi:hypothetical protein